MFSMSPDPEKRSLTQSDTISLSNGNRLNAIVGFRCVWVFTNPLPFILDIGAMKWTGRVKDLGLNKNVSRNCLGLANFAIT